MQENCIDLVGRIADRGPEHVSAREWMRICFELLEMLKAHKKAIRRAAVNTFGYIAKAIGPQDVLHTLLNNLKVRPFFFLRFSPGLVVFSSMMQVICRQLSLISRGSERRPEERKRERKRESQTILQHKSMEPSARFLSLIAVSFRLFNLDSCHVYFPDVA